ncbi:sugar nucleotide-binding protein, partial [Streptomyces sp. NPDC059142]|uniref:sugar nucleotide-binding protein n=1 Tax=Streptomyces sp. NPDC059142 TaxID=3346739 RepID=UPI0036900838
GGHNPAPRGGGPPGVLYTQDIFRGGGGAPGGPPPTTSEAFVRPAPRPAYSILGHDRWKPAGIEPIRDWRAALAEAFPAVLAAERQTGVTSQ